MRRLLALLLLSTGVVSRAQEPAEPPPADGTPDVRLWKEPCDLDGKGTGELLRVSGSSEGDRMSQGRETWRIHLGSELVVELTQEGRPTPGAGATIPEGERWALTCARGAIRVRAGDAELRLTVSGTKASIEPKQVQSLTPDRARDLTRARLEAMAQLLDGFSEEPAVAGAEEASARVGLLVAERAIDAGETDRADAALQQAEAGRFPALAAWLKKVSTRLDATRGAAPIRAVDPLKIGVVERPVTVPVGRTGEGELSGEPDVFWSGALLCVRQPGEQAGTMRCYDTAARAWREPEPYASPYRTGPRARALFLGNAGRYATRITLADVGGERVVGEFQSPSLLARDARGGLVVRSAGRDSPEGEVSVQAYDASAGAGSVLAGGGRYFFDGPASLRSVAQTGRSWKVAVPGGEAGVVCVGEPLTSPDERRAACLAAKAGAKSPPWELWLFGLGETARQPQ